MKTHKRYVAYEAANNIHEYFDKVEDAIKWLKEGDGEGISEEAISGMNYIAEIQYQSVVTETDRKENYCGDDCYECPRENTDQCEDNLWPHDSAFDWVEDHSYTKIEW